MKSVVEISRRDNKTNDPCRSDRLDGIVYSLLRARINNITIIL